MRAHYQIIFPRPDFDMSNHLYDDAMFPAQDIDDAELPFKCAIADGANNTRSAGAWAASLVDRYVNADWNLSAARTQWDTLDLAPKAKVAFAAFVGVTIEEASPGRGLWRATAIGDSCIVHISNGRVANSFPVTSSYDFKRSPVLIASTTAVNDHHVQSLSREFVSGDTFVLMTDGFAKFLLAPMARGIYLDELTNLAGPALWKWAFDLCLAERANSKHPYDASLLKIHVT